MLASGIAHDFNSILSIIKGSVQLIESRSQKPEIIQKRIQRIHSVIDQEPASCIPCWATSDEARSELRVLI